MQWRSSSPLAPKLRVSPFPVDEKAYSQCPCAHWGYICMRTSLHMPNQCHCNVYMTMLVSGQRCWPNALAPWLFPFYIKADAPLFSPFLFSVRSFPIVISSSLPPTPSFLFSKLFLASIAPRSGSLKRPPPNPFWGKVLLAFSFLFHGLFHLHAWDATFLHDNMIVYLCLRSVLNIVCANLVSWRIICDIFALRC